MQLNGIIVKNCFSSVDSKPLTNQLPIDLGEIVSPKKDSCNFDKIILPPPILPGPFGFLGLIVRAVINSLIDLFRGITSLSLLKEKTKFEISGDGNVFNKYLPYRNSIENDKSKLDEYENAVGFILQNVEISFAEVPLEDKNYCTKYQILKPLRPASKYLIAASIVELLHKRPDLIKKVMKEKQPFNILLVQKIKDNIGGFYEEEENTLVLCAEDLWSNGFNPSDGYNLLQHEFMHAAELDRDENSCNGLISEMKDEELKDFKLARDVLFEAYEAHRNSLESAEAMKANQMKFDVATGLRNYAFKNHVEFLTTTIETFYETPHVLQKASARLFDVYCRFFGFNPLLCRRQAAASVD